MLGTYKKMLFEWKEIRYTKEIHELTKDELTKDDIIRITSV